MSSLLQDLVSEHADRAPQAVAVATLTGPATYEALEIRSNQVARLLREQGCRRGDRVCVLSPTVPSALVAMLATFKADAIFVPLDPANDVRRMATVLRAARPAVLLTSGSTATAADELVRLGAVDAGVRLGSLEETPIAGHAFFTAFCMRDAAELSDRPVASRNRATNPACVFFEAGSADRPLGVVTTHSSLSRTLKWTATQFGSGPGDHYAGTTPLASSRAVYEAMSALAVGGTLHPVPADAIVQPRRIVQFLKKTGITQWFTSAETLTRLAEADLVAPADLPALRHVAAWGPSIPRPTLRYWTRRVGQAVLTCLYGTPEAAVATAYHSWPANGAAEPGPYVLGAICPGQEVVVLDDSLQAVRRGEVGDIWIRGFGVSPGYWDDAEATARVFRYGAHGTVGRDRMCRTGDQGRIDPDGRIQLIDAPPAIFQRSSHRQHSSSFDSSTRG